MGKQGSILQSMFKGHAAGMGGYYGSGIQKVSWISLVDWLAAVEFLLQSNTISGPVNLTTPKVHPNALGKS